MDEKKVFEEMTDNLNLNDPTEQAHAMTTLLLSQVMYQAQAHKHKRNLWSVIAAAAILSLIPVVAVVWAAAARYLW